MGMFLPREEEVEEDEEKGTHHHHEGESGKGKCYVVSNVVCLNAKGEAGNLSGPLFHKSLLKYSDLEFSGAPLLSSS